MKKILSLFLVVFVAFAMSPTINPVSAIGGVRNQVPVDNDGEPEIVDSFTNALGSFWQTGKGAEFVDALKSFCPKRLYYFVKNMRIPNYVTHPIDGINEKCRAAFNKSCGEFVFGGVKLKKEELTQFLNDVTAFRDSSLEAGKSVWPLYGAMAFAAIGLLVVVLNVLACLVN